MWVAARAAHWHKEGGMNWIKRLFMTKEWRGTKHLREGSPATVRPKVRMGVVKIHGPESLDVLSGKVPLGYREQKDDKVVIGEPVTYKQAVETFGLGVADRLFAGIKEEDRGN
jgi:hypothetical protein